MNQKKFFLKAEQIQPLATGRGGCIATDLITVWGRPVRFMYRQQPDNKFDSGWRFMSGHEPESYMDNAENHGVYDVNTIANYDPSIIPFLDAPFGSAFEKADPDANFVTVRDWTPPD